MNTHVIITALICANVCTATEVKVWDGDSFRIGPEAVRIANIDTPEIGDKARCAFEADLALQAKAILVDLLASGEVTIHRDGTDRYGRTLAVVSVDGRDAGDALVAAGVARTWAGRREPWCE
jgi:micrococcal nuclease